MKKVIDQFGLVKDGIYRTDSGSLIVKDDRSLNTYRNELQRNLVLTNELNQLKEQIKMILEKLNN
jgi:hypothetical protein